MKILFINKGDTGGGGYKVVWDLASGLMASGHQVDMFVQDKKTNSPRVKTIPGAKWRFYLSHLFGTDFDWFNTDFILDSEEFRQADIVHLNNLHSHYFNLKTLAEICRRKPVVWTFHDLWPVTSYCPHPIDKTLHRGLYFCPAFSTRSPIKRINQRYLTYRKSQLYQAIKFNITVPSRYMLGMLRGTAVAKLPVSLIYNGVDTEIFRPQDQAQVRRQLGLPLDKKIFLFIANQGRFNNWKGWDYFTRLADGLAGHGEVLFLCVGGAASDQYRNIKFIGFIDDSELLSRYYAAVDGLIFPSLAESFGLVVAEAMSCGTPVIAFPVGIAPEVIEHQKNGYLADNQSSQSLLNGVKFILSLSEAQMAAIRRLNRAIIVNKFDKKIMLESFQRLYRQILQTYE